MKYVLICYKPSGEDTCRGCVMRRWNSDHDIYRTTEQYDIIEFLEKKIYENYNLDQYEPLWEFTLFIDGFAYGDDNAPQDHYYDFIFNEARKQATLTNVIAIKKKEKEERIQKQKETARKEAIELAEFERLSKKYKFKV